MRIATLIATLIAEKLSKILQFYNFDDSIVEEYLRVKSVKDELLKEIGFMHNFDSVLELWINLRGGGIVVDDFVYGKICDKLSKTRVDDLNRLKVDQRFNMFIEELEGVCGEFGDGSFGKVLRMFHKLEIDWKQIGEVIEDCEEKFLSTGASISTVSEICKIEGDLPRFYEYLTTTSRLKYWINKKAKNKNDAQERLIIVEAVERRGYEGFGEERKIKGWRGMGEGKRSLVVVGASCGVNH